MRSHMYQDTKYECPHETCFLELLKRKHSHRQYHVVNDTYAGLSLESHVWLSARAADQSKAKGTAPRDGVKLRKKIPDTKMYPVSGANGGGAGNRTPVRTWSNIASTCVVSLCVFDL